MKLPFLIMGLVALSGLAYVTTTTGPSTPEPRTFSRAGAKVVSLGKHEAPKQSKSMTESLYDFARALSGADTGQNETDLADLYAAQDAGNTPIAISSYDELLATVETSLSLANEMGIATGPTAFDADIDARKDAVDPIKRLNN